MMIVHTTKEQVESLLPVFGKLVYTDAGEQDLQTPAWLDMLMEHSSGESFSSEEQTLTASQLGLMTK